MRRSRSLRCFDAVCLGRTEIKTHERHVLLSYTVIIIAMMIVALDTPTFAASGCIKPMTETDRVPILSPPLGKAVIGRGRLQFHSAPSLSCRMNGVFVIPGDSLVAYAETKDGLTSVTYFGGSNPSGWVRSERLKTTGSMASNQ